jgi:hypothetical protein
MPSKQGQSFSPTLKSAMAWFMSVWCAFFSSKDGATYFKCAMYSGEWKACISWSVALWGNLKTHKIMENSETTYEDVHASVEAIVNNELMSHFYAERLHRVLWRIVVRTDLVVVEV